MRRAVAPLRLFSHRDGIEEKIRVAQLRAGARVAPSNLPYPCTPNKIQPRSLL